MSAEPAAPWDPIEEEEPVEQPAPMGRRRRRLRRLIVAFLLFQLIVPLTYYMRADRYDERFAWRMFSAVRMHRCQPVAREVIDGQEREVDMPKVIHQAWINTMARNREDVIRSFLEKRCEGEDTEEVALSNHCTTPGGRRLGAQVYRRECASGTEELPDELIFEEDE